MSERNELPHPSAFGLKLIQAPFPADLRTVLGASAGFRYTGGHWEWRTKEALFFGGYYDLSGDTLAWRIYLRHPACREALQGYDFGRGKHPPKHWLVFDWDDKQVWAGTAKNARRFLEVYWVRYLSQTGIPEIIERDAANFTREMLEYFLDHPEEMDELLDEANTDEAGMPVRRWEGIQKYARFWMELDMVLGTN